MAQMQQRLMNASTGTVRSTSLSACFYWQHIVDMFLFLFVDVVYLPHSTYLDTFNTCTCRFTMNCRCWSSFESRLPSIRKSIYIYWSSGCILYAEGYVFHNCRICVVNFEWTFTAIVTQLTNREIHSLYLVLIIICTTYHFILYIFPTDFTLSIYIYKQYYL